MYKYMLKRILQAVPMIVIISIVCFTLIQLAPFDAVDALVTPNMSEKTIMEIKARYGLDRPAYIQYFYWIKGVLQGDLGYSLVTHDNISTALFSRIPSTIMLVLPAYTLAIIISILLGIIAGYNKNKWLDKIIDGLSSIGIATPTFWIAMIIIYIFGHKYKIFPILGMHTFGKEDSFSDLISHMIMPCTVLILAFIPEMLKYIRASTISQLSQDYVNVQKAYGAKTHEILFKHILKNVLLPVVTIVGMSLPLLVTGAFITESLFSWPGVGPYFVRAIQGFDYPVVMAVMLLSSTLVIMGNLISDILYGIIDPRIKEMR